MEAWEEFRLSECARIKAMADSYDAEMAGLRYSLGCNRHSDNGRVAQQIGKCIARADALRSLANYWAEHGLPPQYNDIVRCIRG